MHISRGWGVTLIFLGTVAFLLVFGFLVIPPLIREVRQLASDIPSYVTKLKSSRGGSETSRPSTTSPPS